MYIDQIKGEIQKHDQLLGAVSFGNQTRLVTTKYRAKHDRNAP